MDNRSLLTSMEQRARDMLKRIRTEPLDDRSLYTSMEQRALDMVRRIHTEPLSGGESPARKRAERVQEDHAGRRSLARLARPDMVQGIIRLGNSQNQACPEEPVPVAGAPASESSLVQLERKAAALVQEIILRGNPGNQPRSGEPMHGGRSNPLDRRPQGAQGQQQPVEPGGWEGEARRIAGISHEKIRLMMQESKQAGAAALDLAAVDTEKKSHAAARLTSLMPLGVQARILGVPVGKAASMPPGVYVPEVILSLANAFSASCMEEGANTLLDLAAFADIMGMEKDKVLEGAPSNAFLAMYLRHVDRRARRKAANFDAQKGRVPSQTDPRFRTEEVQGARDGSAAAQGRLESLGLLQKVGFQFGTDSLMVKNAIAAGRLVSTISIL